jgi:hypothetical protein
VLHGFFLWKAAAGERQRNFSIPWSWLSSTWAEIHGAWNVSVKRFPYSGARGRAACLRYIVNQYLSDQRGYVRYFYSWRRLAGFPIKRLWRMFSRQTGCHGSAYRPGGLLCGRAVGDIERLEKQFRKIRAALWEAFLCGERVQFGDGSNVARADFNGDGTFNALGNVGGVVS